MARKQLQRAGLVIAGLLAAVSLSEGLVRVFFPHSRDHVVPSGLFAMDDRLGWRLTADTTVVHHSQYFDATYRTNALGYRDRARDPSRPLRSARVLVYGDSQIFGWGVPMEERFTDQIEARMSDQEVWNLGVPGYGLDQEVLSYEVDGGAFHADEVVFFIDDDTLDRIRFDYIYRKNKPKFVLDGNKLALMPVKAGAAASSDALYRVLSPLYLPYFLERRLALLRRTAEPTSDSASDSIEESGAIDDLATRILERAQRVARKRGHRMTLLVDLPAAAMAAWRRYCDETGVDFLTIDVSEAAGLRFGSEDRHWTPAAHQLIADGLVTQFASRGRRAPR